MGAQMLQGENVPANVSQLQAFVAQDERRVLQFYILFLLGFISGLAGGHGSRFLNSLECKAVISGIRMLQHLLESSPAEVYWGYLSERARQKGLPWITAEDLALGRLSCLGRMQDRKTFLPLRLAWDALDLPKKQILIDHFLADGLHEQAFLLEFLPDCMAHAHANDAIGLSLLFEVLIDLLGNLRSVVSRADCTQDLLIRVDLSDMSLFTAAVQNRFVFETCMSRCRLSIEPSTGVSLEMTVGNWSRVHDPESDMSSLAYIVEHLVQSSDSKHSASKQESFMFSPPTVSAPLDHVCPQFSLGESEEQLAEAFF